jgi:hypothetical protein
MASDVAAIRRTEEMGMDDFEGKGQPRQLHGWALSPEERGSLKLVLQYEGSSDTAGDHEGLVQLLLPPEAALYLADELHRQAQHTLDKRARRPASADASDPRGNTSPQDRDYENRDVGLEVQDPTDLAGFPEYLKNDRLEMVSALPLTTDITHNKN